MNFDRSYDGPQGFGESDQPYAGSRFSEVRAAIFANSYYRTWGGPGEAGLPVYKVSIGRALRGLFGSAEGWNLLNASRRTLASHADLRWGPDGRGFRRILHPNAVCLIGVWEIDGASEGKSYTGYFRPGSRGLVIGRYSTCCTETRSGHYRSLSLVGKIYPTLDRDHAEPLRPANFITQEDLGGAWSPRINDAELRNAPDTTPWRRGRALPVLLATGVALRLADKEIAIRQVYPIAELGKSADEPTRSPVFMRLTVDPAQPRVEEVDFRDEVLGQIYDRGNPEPKRTLVFIVEVCDEGSLRGKIVQRRSFQGWTRIGRIVFNEAAASYNGDFVLHFHHPSWRDRLNDPSSGFKPEFRGQ